ncbi:MAG: hypothetical protein R2864_05585 [Syntrophotaleaceae bacterium]
MHCGAKCRLLLCRKLLVPGSQAIVRQGAFGLLLLQGSQVVRHGIDIGQDFAYRPAGKLLSLVQRAEGAAIPRAVAGNAQQQTPRLARRPDRPLLEIIFPPILGRFLCHFFTSVFHHTLMAEKGSGLFPTPPKHSGSQLLPKKPRLKVIAKHFDASGRLCDTLHPGPIFFVPDHRVC